MFKIHIADLHVHIDGLGDQQMAEIRRLFHTSTSTTKGIIMATAAEHTAQLEAMAARAEKVKVEILAALAKISEGTTTPEQDAAVARIEAVLGGLDDLTVDEPLPV